MREWRRLVAEPVPDSLPDAPAAVVADDWRRDGERTCAAVYGAMYDRLNGSGGGLGGATAAASNTFDPSTLDANQRRILGIP